MTEQEYRELKALTNAQVKFQLDKHGVINHEEFFEDVGHNAPFIGAEVLDWLGY